MKLSEWMQHLEILKRCNVYLLMFSIVCPITQTLGWHGWVRELSWHTMKGDVRQLRQVSFASPYQEWRGVDIAHMKPQWQMQFVPLSWNITYP